MMLRRLPFLGFSLFLFFGGCQTRSSFDFGSYSQAEHFYEKGEYEKAIKKYQEYVRENRDGNMVAISYYYMAKSYDALKKRDEAREYYRKIIQDFPKSSWAAYAKTRLQELQAEPSPSL